MLMDVATTKRALDATGRTDAVSERHDFPFNTGTNKLPRCREPCV